MGKYRKVELSMYADEKFMRLSPMLPSGQSLWLYLLTGPHTGHIPGLFVCGKAAMAEALNWTPEAFAKAFDEVLAEGMLRFDAKTRLMWLPKAIVHNMPESPNVVRSWKQAYKEIPKSDLLYEAVSLVKESICARGDDFTKAFGEVFGEVLPKPCRKTMPNHEHELKHEHKHKEELPPTPKTEEWGVPSEPDHSNLPSIAIPELQSAVTKCFQAKNPIWPNMPRQVEAIRWLCNAFTVHAEKIGSTPENVALTMIERFWQLKESGRDFFRKQPFEPKMMESLWGQILAETEQAVDVSDISAFDGLL